jgi:hypothetical protein
VARRQNSSGKTHDFGGFWWRRDLGQQCLERLIYDHCLSVADVYLQFRVVDFHLGVFK